MVLLLGAACAAAPPVSAQEAAPAVDPAPPVRAYRIGPGDLLSLRVTGEPIFTRTTRVSNSGKIHMPHVGILRVSDLTTSELEAELARQLRERGFVKEPWVTVRVEEYRSQPVYILGEVILPGQFVIRDEMYLTDLIALSGGFNEVASPVGYLYRRKPDAGDLPPGEAPADEALPVDFAALNEGRNPELNVRLRGGDVLYVPQRRQEHVFVVGDVVRPGAYKRDDKRLLASQALAMAGGPLRTAKLGRGLIVRFDANGARQEIPMDFGAILRGRRPDIPIEADDILFIPGSRAKSFGYALLGFLPGVVSGRVTEEVR